MWSRVISVVVALTAVASAMVSAAPLRHPAAPPDLISGDWVASFEVEGTRVPVTFKLKLDGDKVTGTAASQHTGPGTLSNGLWAAHKLSFTMNFAAHESIAVTGILKDGKLVGEFRTEGRQGTWEAQRVASARTRSQVPNHHQYAPDMFLAGEWEAERRQEADRW